MFVLHMVYCGNEDCVLNGTQHQTCKDRKGREITYQVHRYLDLETGQLVNQLVTFVNGVQQA